MAFKIEQVMERSGVAFGTSGARGLAAAMTDYVCYNEADSPDGVVELNRQCMEILAGMK